VLDILDEGETDYIHIHHGSEAKPLLYAYCLGNHLPGSITPEAIFDLQYKPLTVLVANRFMSICTIIRFLLYCFITILSI
jgi:hypothetical protein